MESRVGETVPAPHSRKGAATPTDNYPPSLQEKQNDRGSKNEHKDGFSSPSSEATTSIRTNAPKQSWSDPSMNKWRILAACLQCFGNGANDAAPGAIIPSAEAFYHVDYSIISTIFVAIAIGFISAAFFVDAIDRKLGRSKTLVICDVLCIIGHAIMVATPPFPAFAVAYFFVGFGQAINLALNNVYCANLAGATVILGLFHGAYGLGGTLSPIIATSIISTGNVFTRFYIFLLCLRGLSAALAGWAFRGMEADAERFTQSRTASAADIEEQLYPDRTIQARPSKLRVLAQSLRKKTTIVGALFIFAYQGAEVTDAGWISSFLINVRQGNPLTVTYVPSGFWAGITIGRLVLSYVAFRYVGEVRFTYVVLLLAIGMQLISWLVPDVVGSAAGVSLVGLFIGPIYPCATVVFAQLLERSLQETSVAFITSSGSAGGAIWPLVTGILSQSQGTWVLHPICVGLLGMMICCWVSLTWNAFGT